MEKHNHRWIPSARGCQESPGVWSDGNGALISRDACACGACRRTRESYCGRDGDYTQIIWPGEEDHCVEDVQTARGAEEGANHG